MRLKRPNKSTQTPKALVTARYPRAICTQWVNAQWVVTAVQNTNRGILGAGPTIKLAWANAAKGLPRNEPTSCWRDSRGRPKARGHFAMPLVDDADVLKRPSAVGRPAGESAFDSELDALENG